MLERKIYSVVQINHYIKGLLENDVILAGVWVKGEISNYKKHSSGHLYFTLKDSDAAVNCIMFKADAIIMPFEIENGMSVIVYGYVSVYEKTGQYQLYAQIIEPVGLGALSAAYEQMKERLLQEGLFDEDFKRPICKNPKKIAVITSPTGAAIRDIINISQRRNPSVEIVVIPVLVQGEKAADTIVEAIKDVNKWGMADTIIVGRGGGSIEDLWAFNEEKVARAIFGSNIPVISAVGHETDFTIADFVSDLRAPTPSAAAELAVNDVYADIAVNENLFERLEFAFENCILSRTKYIELLSKNVSAKGFEQEIAHKEIYNENMYARLTNAISVKIKESENSFLSLAQSLEMLSPMKVLGRGYSVLYDENKNVVSSVEKIEKRALYMLKLKDGSAYMRAEDVETDG